MGAQIQLRDQSVEVRQAWLQIYKLILQTKGCIYVDNTIKNGKKRQKKIEKTREPDGANIIVKQYNNNYKLTSIPIISIQLNVLSRNYP